MLNQVVKNKNHKKVLRERNINVLHLKKVEIYINVQYNHIEVKLVLTYFDQKCLSVIFKDTNAGVVCSILNSRKCCLPWCDPRGKEHRTDRRAYKNKEINSGLM